MDRAGGKSGNKGARRPRLRSNWQIYLRQMKEPILNGGPPSIPKTSTASAFRMGHAGRIPSIGDSATITTRSTPKRAKSSPSPTSSWKSWRAARVASAGRSTSRSRRNRQHWRLERMAVVDRNILRLAIYELSAARTCRPGHHRRSDRAGPAVFERRIAVVHQWRARCGPEAVRDGPSRACVTCANCEPGLNS